MKVIQFMIMRKLTVYSPFDTMSFIDLIFNYKSLINNSYNKVLDQSLHTLLLPFLMVMTGLALY